MQSYHRLESLMNLQPGYRREFIVAGRQLLLTQPDNKPYLIENRCPHQGFSLIDAQVSGGNITCAAHMVTFSLENGQIQGESHIICSALKTFELVFQGNEVGVFF